VKFLAKLLIGLVMVFSTWLLAAQQPAPSEASDKVVAAQADRQPANATDNSVHEQLAHPSKEAEGEEEHAEFKHSPSVQFVAKLTGLSVNAAYWLLIIINFAIIGALLGWALKKNLPQMFRARTEIIRKSMDEARRASEDANRRLAEIEGRLAKLDSDVEAMKGKAESDAAQEEHRIRASAEEDGRKIVTSAEQEIEAAAKTARRELKAYAAELAVSLAEKKIAVDSKTDEALVNTFVHQLGKDGR
jgi:F-type H+-transporting ATPase subunit b